MQESELQRLAGRGWRISRDGSTSTAHLAWDDPDDPDSGWEILVLHTAGHGSRFTLNSFGSGLTERPAEEAARLLEGLADAAELLQHWGGEILDEP